MSEEEYLPKNSIVKDDLYDLYKDLLTCPLCSEILRQPIICMKCQKSFCKKCLDKYPNKKEKCPNNCDNPIYKDDATKLQILSKTKYECKNCGETVFYDDIESHLNSNCEAQIITTIKEKKVNEYRKEENEKKLVKLQPEECEHLKTKGKKINYIKSKKFIFIIIILFF